MACYYHPEREGTDRCAICGKSICKECGLEIAGKVYCKECLEKIVGLGIDSNTKKEEVVEEPIRTEPARLNKQPVEENIYEPQEEIEYIPQVEPQRAPEIKQISDDSPYNIKDNFEYSGGLETSYQDPAPEPQVVRQTQPIQEPQITQTREMPNEAPLRPRQEPPQEYIYPDHSYEPEPTSARRDLEDKYEKYLDDLYFDEEEVPLGEQLAKDEQQYGSLTRKEYPPKQDPLLNQKSVPRNETPEEMEARIRAEILAEKNGVKPSDTNIHNLNYQNEKEPMGAVDIILTIILIIVILIVVYYIIYIFVLHAAYPTFMDAVYGLSNPQNVINNVLSPQQ